MSSEEVPQWLSALLSEKFFNACIIHEDAKKNEKKVFCLDCCDGLCPHCSINHRSHRLLQIRRYMYNDVIRVDDADKLFDCAQVQTYITNGKKVVFLNKRRQTGPSRVSGNFCVSCDRNMQQESAIFCSISCKLRHIRSTDRNLSTFLRNIEYLALPDGSDDAQMTASSVLEQSGSISGSSSGDLPDRSTATTEIDEERSNLPAGLVRRINRRKGNPRRSALR